MTQQQTITIRSALLVDDEPDNVELIQDALEFKAIAVQSAGDGEQALAKLQTFTPDVILLDLSMPVMDGWETHKRLKTNTKTQCIPVVALTAHAMSGDKQRVLDAGFDGYVPKPINVATFVDDLTATLRENMRVKPPTGAPPAEAAKPPATDSPETAVPQAGAAQNDAGKNGAAQIGAAQNSVTDSHMDRPERPDAEEKR